MVHLDYHRRGIGKALLAYRLNEIRRDPIIRRVTINTSQHTSAFFEKFGFTVERVVRDGYGPGLDRCEMNLIVTPDSQKSNSGAIIST
jgi:ribosomal protein S18 acetylase RimI-like enzyme